MKETRAVVTHREADARASIRTKRVYEPASPADGVRFLVERLWPRGLKKESLCIEGWVREVAPSTELRRWFGHDPAKWDEFRRRYHAELEAHPDAWRVLLDAARHGPATLLYSAQDITHNNAIALQEYLAEKLRSAD
ncbi:MAG: DUF488 domain-containing protein [Betaproteobacteria bacterium]|nr:DUF488 domain-containing protein [Betaproteobacteria bacterium]